MISTMYKNSTNSTIFTNSTISNISTPLPIDLPVLRLMRCNGYYQGETDDIVERSIGSPFVWPTGTITYVPFSK